jgi:plastocyanin
MFSLLRNRKFISLFHILIVAPLLVALGTDRFPQEYKKLLLVIAGLVVLYHSYNLYNAVEVAHTTEGMMAHIDGANVYYVTMFDSSPGYNKPVLRVSEGDVVVWKNVGEVDHSVLANTGEFNSGNMKPGDSFSVQFNKKGDYYYYDVDHRGWMRGIILVV